MERPRLVKGKKYNLLFPWGSMENMYYLGKLDDCDYTCTCCDKVRRNGYEFSQGKSYEECMQGHKITSAFVGTSCVRKIGIAECEEI